METFHVENFGCRAARADGEAVSARLLADGMAEAELSRAGVVIVNTCSVTAEADRDARAFVRKTMRLNPAAKIVVTGCYAQRAPEEIAAIQGVTAVVGNSHKGLLPELIQQIVTSIEPANPSSLFPVPLLHVDDQFAHSSIEHAQIYPGAQTRPNLKIQEGCSNRCTFCIIPTTRGASRSLPAEKVLAQVHGFIQRDGKELVLSGINLGRWGRDLTPPAEIRDFSSLVRTILAETPLPRLRLSSIEPMDWTPELVGSMREFGPSARLARHAHLPLQSGSDAVLRRMHRRYRPWHYAEKIAALVEAAGPDIAIGADVMIGFPAETDAEFRETYDFLSALPFTYLHLFPFSPRPGTRGWELHRQTPVSASAVHERLAALRRLIAAKTLEFRSRFLDRKISAITLNTSEASTAHGYTSALTDNFIPIALDAALPPNQLVEVTVSGIRPSGELVGCVGAQDLVPAPWHRGRN